MKISLRALSVLGLAAALGGVAQADVKLPNVIGSNMVLQREVPLPVWGWADAGEEVTVTLGDATAKATAGADGKWSVKLPAQKAGGPHNVVVQGKNKIELTPGIDVDRILDAMKRKYASERINTSDGVKIDFEKEQEWVHLRKSNTEPIIRVYAESRSEERANALAKRVVEELKQLAGA